MLSSLVNSLRSIELQKMPQNWVTAIWDSQFTDNPSLDSFEGKP